MTWIALKMLTGDREKYLAILFGVAFASLLTTEQSATFCGGLKRLLPGSVADKVLRGADAPMLLARQADRRHECVSPRNAIH